MSGIVGVVIIGRNEGARLKTCLASVGKNADVAVAGVVYVDSGSSDGSVEAARGMGAEVLALDMTLPFTAARARNMGAAALLAKHPEIAYVQFIDGDTELDGTWLGHASRYLDIHGDIAVVSGRLRERYPEATIYNLLADMEWDTPVGVAHEFGGNAMIRAAVFQKLGGFSGNFIAGEEPDLAARMRRQGGKIMRLSHEMAKHDLGMTSVRQWWRRNVRSGHALAQLYHVHGGAPLFFYKKQWRSTLFWGLGVPAGIVVVALVFSVWGLCLFPVGYGYLMGRIVRYRLKHGDDRDSACTYGAFTTVGKFPQLWGMGRFYWNLWRRRESRIIEYKGAGRRKHEGTKDTKDHEERDVKESGPAEMVVDGIGGGHADV